MHRDMNTSKKIYIEAKIILFDFELLIGGRRRNEGLTAFSRSQPLKISGVFIFFSGMDDLDYVSLT
jgi:hypothetical protein